MKCLRGISLVLMLAASALVVEGAAAQDQARFTLSGIVIRDDGSGRAWLIEPTFTQNRERIVRQGDRVGPYTVAKITDDRVELAGPDGPVVVRLYTTGTAGTPAGASQPPSGPRIDVAERTPKSPAEIRAWLDAVSDPTIRTSSGWGSLKSK